MAMKDTMAQQRGSRYEHDEPDFVGRHISPNSQTHDQAGCYDKKNWANIKGAYLIKPILGGDGRVLVQEDPPKSKFDCVKCGGAGHNGVACKYCKGTKFEKGDEENGYCRDCTVGDSHTNVGRTLGFEPCTECKGQGGSIIIPDEAQRNTTMGTVVAVSSKGILEVKVGDRLVYTNYTGTQFKFVEVDLRSMCEKDAIGIIKQLKANADQLTQGTYADLENTGVPHE